jgi:integrase
VSFHRLVLFLYALAVYTDMSRGELLALRWADVSLGDRETEPGVVRVHRTLTRTEDGKGIALGDPKTKKSGHTVCLTPGTPSSATGRGRPKSS